MGRYDRSIKIAFDKTSGKLLEADEVFDITTDAFEIRKKFNPFLLRVRARLNGIGK